MHSHEMKPVVNRLSRAIGHLQSVKTMVEDHRDCTEVLTQLEAVKSALSAAERVILKEHMEHCIVDAIRDGDYEKVIELNKAIDKMLK